MQLNSYQSFHAPVGNGDAILTPSVGTLANWTDQADRFAADTRQRFGDLQRLARGELLRDAIQYTAAYRGVPDIARAADASTRIVMAGHQPSLFHAGVWFKNFVLDRIGRQNAAVAINLVVDNDVSSGVSIRVPTRDTITDELRLTTVAYDEFGGGVPYEQTAIQNHGIFASFNRHVSAALIGVVENPAVNQLWPHAIDAIGRCDIAACALAQARHGLEFDLGLETLEIPIGVASRGYGFARFVVEILADLPRFVQIYNNQTERYRVAHSIRSHAHPVPDLKIDDGWIEAPLWVYGNSAPHRRGIWVRRTGDQVTIGDRDQTHLTIDLGDRDRAAEQWIDQSSSELKLRPRALLTTMYSRWILSDLFLHGIGGGKYDQLGDAIASEFFGFEPPPYFVTSATIHLPGAEPADTTERRRQLIRRLRDCRYQPETIEFDFSKESRAKIGQKQQLLSAVPPRGERTAWTGRIDEINRDLASELAAFRAETAHQLFENGRRAAQNRLLESREHSFCILPLDYMTKSFAQILGRLSL